MKQATSLDFIYWKAKAKTLSIESLNWVIMDCRLAAEAMATLPAPNNENYYRDQGMTFADELRKRKAS
jgi:hypothetical protein